MVLASLILSSVSCILVFYAAGVLFYGVRRLRKLTTKDSILTDGPLVSVIIAACNEEKNIEPAIRALLAQTYSYLEIIAVNDRSTDKTGEVLARLSQVNARLKTIDINLLPEDWIGKSHALAVGAAAAQGEFLLFTDADVVMEPTTVGRSLYRVIEEELDHLSLIFKNQGGSWLLNCLILQIALGLLVIFQPWQVKRREKRNFIGIGAFNLVRRNAYEAVGGHASIRMHPLDDLMLGKILKENGARQDCYLASEFISVPWYETVPLMIAGLNKNVFALCHYRVWQTALLVMLLIIINILPPWGCIMSHGVPQIIWGVSTAMQLVIFINGLRLQNYPLWYGIGAVIAPYLIIFILLNSAFSVLSRGGVVWRGQLYSLEKLRQAKKVLF